MRVVEKGFAETAVMVKTICQTVNDLTLSINKLIDNYSDVHDKMDNKIILLEKQTVENKVKTDANENMTKELRGLIIGGMGTAILVLLGWLVWWLQNHYAAVSTFGGG